MSDLTPTPDLKRYWTAQRVRPDEQRLEDEQLALPHFDPRPTDAKQATFDRGLPALAGRRKTSAEELPDRSCRASVLTTAGRRQLDAEGRDRLIEYLGRNVRSREDDS
jgi:hypothetical protein